MLRRILVAGIAATFTLAATDFHGKWGGIMVLNNRAASISLNLHQADRSVSGTVTFGGNQPAKIENPELTGNLLTFAVHDASGSAVQFRLKVVYGPLIGEVFHNGEALTGEAQCGDRIAEVMLPSHSGGTVPAVVLRSVPAEYPEEARRAKIQGAVRLSVLIDDAGRPVEFQVLRGLGMGLDKKAIEAVKQWQFKPALRDGKPVTLEATIEVNFRSL
ncbi:MAG: energy transducer TonB [Bryobacteraceae bacterium]|jgi:TonB family protein